jgi:hypothetical protein
MSAPLADLVAALDRAVRDRAGRADGQEMRFLCPAHDDHNPSARWNREKKVWRCDVCGASGGARDLARRLGVELPAVGVQAAHRQVYTVRDTAGRVVAEHVRIEDAGGRKRFAWRRDGRSGLRGLRVTELPLYGAERVAGFDPSRPVFVCEGEKAADRLLGVGAQAVGTVTGASSTPGAGPLGALRGLDVVLWPDHDLAGAQHMERVASLLRGLARSVRIFLPAELPAGGDAVEWIEKRSADGMAILEELETAAGALPVRDRLNDQGSGDIEACSARRIVADSPADPVEAGLLALGAAADARAAEPHLRQLGEALRAADALQRATVRERAILALRGRVNAAALMVDAALTPCRPATPGQGQAVGFEDPQPWPDPVDGAALLLDLAAVLNRYVALPAHADVATALWSIHAHALAAADTSPILALVSPEKRCGKTRTLLVLSRLVPRPLSTSNITPAALFRTIELFSPTLLIDEAETFLGERDDLRGVLNSGHSRGAAFVVRTAGDDYEPRRFSTWAAKAVALIGRLPETLTDRSIVIPMRRRAPEERIERLRLDRPGAFVELCRRAARWAADHLAELCAADPEVPSEISDRAADNWRPLLAIADLAGGEWPRRARQAALALSGAEDSQDGAREQLLGDIRDAFREREVKRIFTEDLLADLCAREDRPWREWRHGNCLTAIQLARLLKPFGIRPRSMRDSGGNAKGYELAAFADAFGRYLPAEPSQPSQIKEDGPLLESETRHTPHIVTSLESSATPYEADVVTGVTARNQ